MDLRFAVILAIPNLFTRLECLCRHLQVLIGVKEVSKFFLLHQLLYSVVQKRARCLAVGKVTLVGTKHILLQLVRKVCLLTTL